jgi:hypothetical protein
MFNQNSRQDESPSKPVTTRTWSCESSLPFISVKALRFAYVRPQSKSSIVAARCNIQSRLPQKVLSSKSVAAHGEPQQPRLAKAIVQSKFNAQTFQFHAWVELARHLFQALGNPRRTEQRGDNGREEHHGRVVGGCDGACSQRRRFGE